MVVMARVAHHNKSTDFSLADYLVKDLRDIPKIISRLSN
jgi:hypothetical protein